MSRHNLKLNGQQDGILYCVLCGHVRYLLGISQLIIVRKGTLGTNQRVGVLGKRRSHIPGRYVKCRLEEFIATCRLLCRVTATPHLNGFLQPELMTSAKRCLCRQHEAGSSVPSVAATPSNTRKSAIHYLLQQNTNGSPSSVKCIIVCHEVPRFGSQTTVCIKLRWSPVRSILSPAT